jgi:hypothetical protein
MTAKVGESLSGPRGSSEFHEDITKREIKSKGKSLRGGNAEGRGV